MPAIYHTLQLSWGKTTLAQNGVIDCDVNNDELWDIQKIKHQADENEREGYKDVRMKGVRSHPYFTIPFERCIFSGLHAGIGIGSRLKDHLEEFIDIDIEIESLSRKEFQLRE